MDSLPRSIRRPLIALVAVCAVSFAAGDASACSTMTQGNATCATVCGCCAGGEGTARAGRADVAGPAAMPGAPRVGCPASGDTCSCRSQTPVAPAPRPARGAVERHDELSKVAVLVRPGNTSAAPTTIAPQVPATHSPPRAPLYLQYERLLF